MNNRERPVQDLLDLKGRVAIVTGGGWLAGVGNEPFAGGGRGAAGRHQSSSGASGGFCGQFAR